MREVYGIGLTFRFAHGYFRDGLLRGVKVIPCTSTAEYMKMNCVLQRSDVSEFLLLYRQGNSIAPNTKLRFWLQLTDMFFFNYTDGPMGIPQDGVYLFTANSSGAAQADGSIQVNNTWATVPVRTPLFDYPVSSSVASVTVTNQDDGKTYFFATVQKGEVVSAGINLFGAPEGMYSLNDGTQTWNFFMTKSMPGYATQAILEIDLAGDTPVTYSLGFSPRQTYWKYQVIATKNGSKQYSIASNNGVTFSPATPGTGNVSAEIVSEQPIVFKEVPSLRLQLMEANGSTAQKVVVPDLPAPSPARLCKGTAASDTKLYSETYVYI